MSIFKFRVLIESTNEDDLIFKDIEIKSTQSFEDLHEIIVAAFGFDNSQMASFYLSDENWSKGQEIALFDMNMEGEDAKIMVMSDTAINTQITCVGNHLLYSYDFLNLKNFFIELIEIQVKETADFYPRVTLHQGEYTPPTEELSGELSEEEMANELLKQAGFDDEGNDDVFKDDIFEDFDDFENYQ